jgi:hypothetical protein
MGACFMTEHAKAQMKPPRWLLLIQHYNLRPFCFIFLSFSRFWLCVSLGSRLACDIILLQRQGVNDNFLILIYSLYQKKILHFEGLCGKPSQPGQCPNRRDERWRHRSFFYLKECAVSLLPDVPHDIYDMSSGVTFWLLSKWHVASSHRA